jgi:hypothetical protein
LKESIVLKEEKRSKSALLIYKSPGGWSATKEKGGEHLDISSLFKAEKKKNSYYTKDGWEVSLTFKCDGLVVHRIWERDLKEQRNTSANKARKCETAEFSRRIDGRAALVKEGPSKVIYSTDAAAFDRGENGLYYSGIWALVNLASLELYGVDPGIIDVISSAFVQECGKLDLADTSRGVKQGPRKGKSQSRAEIKDRCGGGVGIRDNVLTAKMSRCSLRTVNLRVFLKNLPGHSKLAKEVIETFGSNQARSSRLKRDRKTRSYYDKIADELFPNKDCVVAMGNGNIDPSRSPISRFIKEIAKRRRCGMVDESYTTRRCSGCRSREFPDLVAVADNKYKKRNLLKTQKQKKKEKKKVRRWRRFGKPKKSEIHGLRQCKNCRRTWNRDFNAARNIAIVAIHQWRCEGRRPDYVLHPNAPETGAATCRSAGCFDFLSFNYGRFRGGESSRRLLVSRRETPRNGAPFFGVSPFFASRDANGAKTLPPSETAMVETTLLIYKPSDGPPEGPHSSTPAAALHPNVPPAGAATCRSAGCSEFFESRRVVARLGAKRREMAANSNSNQPGDCFLVAFVFCFIVFENLCHKNVFQIDSGG